MMRIIPVFGLLAFVILSSLSASISVGTDPALANGEGMFDRERCLRGCQNRYGGLGAAWEDGARVASETPYTRCMEECERAFWKERDSERDGASPKDR